MAKDPAFLFYPGDWLGGTQYLTLEQKGCYIELLVLQYNTGGFTEAQAKQVLSICFDVAWPVLKQKFTKVGSVYRNDRLQMEIEKRKKFSESRRINGLSPKKKEKEDEAYAKHMENENENRNESKDLKGVQGEKIEVTYVADSTCEVMDHPYVEKIKSEYRILLKVTNPLTNEEAERLERDIGDEVFYDKLMGLANRKDVLKKYNSVNLTIRNWVSLDKKKNGSTKSDSGTERIGRMAVDDLKKFMSTPLVDDPLGLKRGGNN